MAFFSTIRVSGWWRKGALLTELLGANYGTTLNSLFLSPSVEDWRGVGEVTAVWDWGTTQETWGPQSYIKDLDRIVLSINLGFCSVHTPKIPLWGWQNVSELIRPGSTCMFWDPLHWEMRLDPGWCYYHIIDPSRVLISVVDTCSMNEWPRTSGLMGT